MRRLMTVLLPMLVLSACFGSRTETTTSHDGPAGDGAVVLYKNLGRYAYRITTTSSNAQR